MESATNALSKEHTEVKNHVRAGELLSLLDQCSHKIKILSLDCFDTLIWRKTATPYDVFFDLQNKPPFRTIGFTARMRAQAEELSRNKMLLSYGTTEVKLKDIYSTAFPQLSNGELETLIEAELSSELDACYAFPQTVELIRKAHSRGLKIIIVSDTYLDEPQLRRLLQKCLPDDVMQMILKIFCSSDHGKSKSSGLFKTVTDKIFESAHSILHIGDNLTADCLAPKSLGINAVQLLQYDKKITELARMQALSGSFLDPTIRYNRSLSNPFKAVMASSQTDFSLPESAIGYASLGPIMYAFAQFICDEVEQLSREGKRPKVLFLLRDAYLPSLACEALAGKKIGACVKISRFASFAASFRSKEDVDRYLGETVMSLRFYDMCKQLLIPDQIAGNLCEEAAKDRNPAFAFIRRIQQKDILALILKNSSTYRMRMNKYLQNEVGLEKGDTLVFVDLGYTGTSQLKLEPVFREEMGIDIVGRYLIALPTPGWKDNRKGLLDSSWCDERIMLALVAYIALLEQLCTTDEKSVIDYDNNGRPIYSETALNTSQFTKLNLIQSESLRFIRDADHFFKTANTHLNIEMLRDFAMAELGRMLFLPTETELEYLKSFEFDLNLGTKDIIGVFDQEKGLAGLRKRGLFFMERNLKSMRTNYPAELRSAGLELVLTLMAQHRTNFDIRVTDLSLRRENLHVIAMRGNSATQTMIEALPTHDGYFALIIPVGTGDMQVGVQFGLNYHWVQLESAELILTHALYGSKESDHTVDASANLLVDQMVDKGGGLYECQSDSSLLVFMPNRMPGNQNHALRIVFRPIVTKPKRQSQPANQDS